MELRQCKRMDINSKLTPVSTQINHEHTQRRWYDVSPYPESRHHADSKLKHVQTCNNCHSNTCSAKTTASFELKHNNFCTRDETISANCNDTHRLSNKLLSSSVNHKQSAHFGISKSTLNREFSQKLLHILLATLLFSSIMSSAFALKDTSTHTLSSSSTQQSLHSSSNAAKDVFLSPSKWRIEDLDANPVSDFIPSPHKVRVQILNAVAYTGRLFQTSIKVDTPVDYHLSSNDFTIDHKATEAGRSHLPTWLHLNPLSGELSGVPLSKDVGKVYLSVDVRISHSDGRKPETVNEVFLIEVSTVYPDSAQSMADSVQHDGSSCTSRHSFLSSCLSDETPVVASILFVTDFNKLRPLHRANLFHAMSDLVGICPEHVWLYSVDWTTEDGMRLWTQLADPDVKELLSFTTILSFQINCSANEASTEVVSSELKTVLEGVLAICSNGIVLDENGYTIVDCYQWFITSGSFIIDQSKMRSDHFESRNRVKRQEETDTIEFVPDQDNSPPNLSSSLVSMTSSTDSLPSPTTTSGASSDSSSSFPRPTTLSNSFSVAAPPSRVVPSSDMLTFLPSQSNRATSVSLSLSTSTLFSSRELFDVITSMPQFVMSSMMDFDSVTTAMPMVITPTLTRVFSFSIPSSIEEITSTSVAVTTSIPVSTSHAVSLSTSSLVVSTSSIVVSTLTPNSTVSSVSVTTQSSVSSRLASTALPSMTFQSPSPTTTILESIFDQTRLTTFTSPTPSPSIPQTSDRITVSETSTDIFMPSSTIPVIVDSTIVFTVEPSVSDSTITPSRSFTMLMPMPTSELTLSISMFTPSSPVTSVPITLTVFTPEPTPTQSISIQSSEVFIAPTSTILAPVDTSIFTFSTSSFTSETTPSVTPSFSDFFDVSTSTPVFFVTSLTSSIMSTTSVSQIPSLSFTASLSSSSSSRIDLTSLFPSPTPTSRSLTTDLMTPVTSIVFISDPTTSVFLLTPDESTPTPSLFSFQPTSTFNVSLTRSSVEPSSLAETSTAIPSLTPSASSIEVTETFIFPTMSSDVLMPMTTITTSVDLTETFVFPTMSTGVLIPFSPTPSFSSSIVISTSIRSLSISPTLTPTPTPIVTVCETVDCGNGTCIDLGEDFRCDCFLGWDGEFCDIDIDYCFLEFVEGLFLGPCDVQGAFECIDGNSTYTCVCLPGFTGQNCSVDIDECDSNPCVNNATCINELFGTFTCSCATGFTGPLCEIDIDECDLEPCMNNATCINELFGTFTCSCATGFTGPLCEIDIDECDLEPCMNNATCINELFGTFTCSCATGFTGPLCEIDIDPCMPNPCLDNEVCIDMGSGIFECIFIPPTTTKIVSSSLSPSMTVSMTTSVILTSSVMPTPTPNVTVCEMVDCGNGTCIDLGEDFRCDCFLGWDGPFCDIDIDYCFFEVSNIGPCDVQGTFECLDGNSTYTCVCLPGFTGQNCSVDIDECDPNPCVNNATCINELFGTFTCSCATGFTGPLCEIDIDECDSNPCMNNATCTNELFGTFNCSCATGFTGPLCEIDIDECDSNPCMNNATCINELFGTFTCSCSTGFTGSLCEIDIDECDLEPCMNNATCINELFGTFTCSCTPGFTGPFCDIDLEPCVPNPCKEDETCMDLGDGIFDCITVTPELTTKITSTFSTITMTTSIISTSVVPTTTPVFSPSPTPTPTPANVCPTLLNPVGTILSNEGQLFRFVVPDNTFYDPESGTADQLSLSLLDLTGNQLSNTTWIQLRYLQTNTAVIEGVPLREQVSLGSITDHVFLLRAEDPLGCSAHDLVTVRVIPQSEPIDNFLVVFFEGEFDVFNQNLTAKVELYIALSSFGDDGNSDIYIDSFTSGSIAVSYNNLSLPNANCDDFIDWFDAIFSNGTYTENFISSLAPFIPTNEPRISGPCNETSVNPTVTISTPPPPGQINPTRQSDRILLLATVIPTVLLAFLCLIIGVLAFVLYRRRRSERKELYTREMRQTFLHRRPVILAGEADLPPRSRRPVILTNDLVVRDEDEHRDLPSRGPLLEEVDYHSEPSDNEDEEIMTSPLLTLTRRDRFSPPPEDLPPEYKLPPLYTYPRFRYT